jgi:hypothetical protein
VTATDADIAARSYDPRPNGYDLAKDPRCLYGWGPPSCNCRFGHGCFRAFGHRGRCWDAGDAPSEHANPLPCETRQRPTDWDTHGRAEANR